jgi:flagellum-specific ATP synthase
MDALDRIFDETAGEVLSLAGPTWHGEVVSFMGMTIEARGLERILALGDKCRVELRDGRQVYCESIGVRNGNSLLMALDAIEGVSIGDPVYFDGAEFTLRPSSGWKGRVIDGLGRPIDGQGTLPEGDHGAHLKGAPPNAYDRKPVGPRITTGIRGIDLFAPICRGQRMGIFSGSGVGKSTVMSMLARYAEADTVVIGLIGERGREVQEFLREDLGPEGLKRSVVVVATGDQPPPLRRQAAQLTMALAEYFRRERHQVLCLMDSITRFAMAQREIGLTSGEPPTSKGYPPTVFSELPKLLERAGPGPEDEGDITGVFSVLVEGDDTNEPISDSVRGILDGHITLDRAIAERGRYPAINILRSISRAVPACLNEEQNAVRMKALKAEALYNNMEEIIRIGAYRRGTDPQTDHAISIHDPLENLLDQRREEKGNPDRAFRRLSEIVGGAGNLGGEGETASVTDVFASEGVEPGTSAFSDLLNQGASAAAAATATTAGSGVTGGGRSGSQGGQ